MDLADLILHKRLFYKEYIDLGRLLAKSLQIKDLQTFWVS